jgi:hypothetical protein
MARWILTLLGCSLLALGGGDPTHPVRVEKVSWTSLPAGWGGGVALLVRFEVAPEWHMYWSNPGDSGAPPEAKAELPEGWRLGTPIWPRPRVLRTDGETLFVHEGSWGWLIPVIGPDMSARPDFAVDLSLSWMACKTVCKVGRDKVRVPAPAAEWPACPAEIGGSPFPSPLGPDEQARFSGDRLHLRLGARGLRHAHFLQGIDPGVHLQGGNPAELPVRDGICQGELPLRVRAQDAVGGRVAITGLMMLGDRPSDPCVWIEQGRESAENPSGETP